MKTNLDSLYKTDKQLESNGVWFEISDTVAFHLRRFGGANSEGVKKALAKHYQPYAARIEKKIITAEKEAEVNTRVFVDACLVDWKGVEIDGKEAKCDFDTAVKFFIQLPDLMNTLMEHCSATESFKEDLGNS